MLLGMAIGINMGYGHTASTEPTYRTVAEGAVEVAKTAVTRMQTAESGWATAVAK